MKGDHKELDVWQKAMNLAEVTYAFARRLPQEEKYALADQMRRAAVSIPSNIAEGHGRQTPKEFIHFLHVARGSAYELETQVLLSQRLYCVDLSQANTILERIIEIKKMIYSLKNYLQRNFACG